MTLRATKPGFRVMGIDPNTYTGVVVLEDGVFVDSKLITFPEKIGFHRLQLIAGAISSVLDQYSPDAVLIEGYAFGNRFTLVTVVEFGTTIRAQIHRRGTPWWSVPPSALKKFTTGVGNAKKDQMAVAVRERWGFTSPSPDVVDAYALARLGWDFASADKPLKINLTQGA